MKFKLRYLVIIGLWMVLGWWIIQLIFRLKAEHTTFATSTNDNFQWPLFTVCPIFGTDNNMQSFEDIMDDIKTAKNNFDATLTNRKGDQIDLKDENVIDQNETWRFQVSAVMGLRNPTICLLLNLQNIDFPNYYILHVNITTMNSSSVGYFVEATKKHEENYETTPDEYDNVMIPMHKNSVFDLSQEITTRKNTKKYKCDKSNSHKKSNCIKKYIAKYIQCKPPWYSEDESEVTNVCIGLTKLEEYQNVTFELSANKTFRQNQTVCYQDNCKQSLWKMKNTAQLPTNAENVTMAAFKAQNYDVHIREEIFNYDELDLIADFGGIMGLLLGASILSVYDFLEVIMRRLFDFIKDKTCPT